MNRHDIPREAAPTRQGAAHAFATLVTNEEYGRGALALVRSLRWTGTTAPLVVLATAEAEHLDELEREGCRIVPVSQPRVSDAFRKRHSREALHRAAPFNKGNKPAFHDPVDNFCKLELWKLTDYEKIVFLDADSLVVKPIDMLFGFPEFSGAPNVYETLADFHRLNSGVFVAEPSLATYESLVERLDRAGRLLAAHRPDVPGDDVSRLAQAPLHLQHHAVRLLQPAGAVGVEVDPRRALPVRKALGGGEPEAASAAAADRSLVADVRRRGAARGPAGREARRSPRT